MIRDYRDRVEKIGALIERYRVGELGEATFDASLAIEGVRSDERSEIILFNQRAHRQSAPYRRGQMQ